MDAAQVGRARPDEVVGREPEQARLSRFLTGIREATAGLTIAGEAGIGKTRLWSSALDEARDGSFRVLSCRPIESETPLSFAGLGDLLSGLEAEVLSGLAGPQRHALEVALLLEEPSGPPLDPRAVAMATLRAIQILARTDPVVLAIDDIHWLDQPSARSLEFAARRLTDEPVGFLCSRRKGLDVPMDLAKTLPPNRHEEISLEPLTMGAFIRLIRTRMDPPPPRASLVRLYEASGGNPLFGLEMARALESTEVPPGEPLPVPPSLLVLVSERLSALSPQTREALTVLAATTKRHMRMWRRIVPETEAADATLAESTDAEIVELNGEWIRFRHPLFASGLLAQLGPEERPEIHRRLADIEDDPEATARHLALATTSPDEDVAERLMSAALGARARGATHAAAELAELAGRLTPASNPGGRAERATLAGAYWFEMGSMREARALLEEAIRVAPPGAVRAGALHHMGWMTAQLQSWSKAQGFYSSALAESHDDKALRGRIAIDASFAHMMIANIPGAAGLAQLGLELAEAAGDRQTIAEGLAMVAWYRFVLGEGIDREAFDRAMELETWDEPRFFERRPSAVYGFTRSFAAELDEARTLFLETERRLDQMGDESGKQSVVFQLAMLEASAGNLRLADEYADLGMLMAEELGQLAIRTFSLLARSRVDTYLGRIESARATAQEGLEVAATTDAVPGIIQHHHTLGLLELSLGNHLGAHTHLAAVAEMLLAHGTGEPSVVPWLPDEVEALVGLGELDKAERLVEMLEERGQELERKWAVAMGARCRGHLSASRKDKDRALKELDRAVRLHEELPLRIELARAWLLKGQAERRFKQWGAARSSLQRALELFEEMGTPLWAERAREELARVGGRGPASRDLTPSEQRIASLVAKGQTNKQVAEALFLSVNTVESNLKRIFHKLGVTSRTELARMPLTASPKGSDKS